MADIDIKINRLLEQMNFDIRSSKDARFMDQKVTPDVLNIIAECIIQFSEKSNKKEFSTKEIWESDYANENVKNIFNKPDVFNKTAQSEYDKFFAQPLRMLAYSGVLNLKKNKNRIFFTIANTDILEYIAIKPRNSLNFIIKYLYKVLRDSDIFNLFNVFFKKNTKQNFYDLKSKYVAFIIQHTPIKTAVEVNRIFTKILNPLCYDKKVCGTKKGTFSKDIIGYDELMYNRANWRDVKKKRGETREEFEERKKEREKQNENQANAYVKFTMDKAKRLIKSRYNLVSEVKDELSVGDATQVHHIFPKSDYPAIKAYLENLILLTPSQHYNKAHSNNTKTIDKDYQLLCILSKSDSIEQSINSNDGFYSKDDFLIVLNTGIDPSSKFGINNSFDEIKEKVTFEYHRN